MKKILLALFLLVGLNVLGQNKNVLKNIDDIIFYGVDFSHTRVFGASETYDQFKVAFEGINNLFLSEPKKYNISKYTGKQVNGIYVDEAKDRVKLLKRNEFLTTNENYSIDKANIATIIKDLDLKEKEGTGLILVAEMLDKAKNRGYFHVVYFDIKSRNITDTWLSDAKARGFGLRNFWAHSVLEVIKSAK